MLEFKLKDSFISYLPTFQYTHTSCKSHTFNFVIPFTPPPKKKKQRRRKKTCHSPFFFLGTVILISWVGVFSVSVFFFFQFLNYHPSLAATRAKPTGAIFYTPFSSTSCNASKTKQSATVSTLLATHFASLSHSLS